MLKKIYILIFLFFSTKLLAEIPIIVISAGKSYQSQSVVGSDVQVLDSELISNSSYQYLGDILSDEAFGTHFSRTGGIGTNSSVQLRGLPKRYTTIYIDGVKMSDPSTPDNSYYLNNLSSNFIDQVEILKGNQSSLYGSGAIGGTINIFSKKPKKDDSNNTISFNVGSNNTASESLSYGTLINNHEILIGLNNYKTKGISAMTDNSERDSYKNKGLNLNYNYNFKNNFRVENNLRYVESFLNYDQAGTNDDKNSTDDEEISYSLKLINENNKTKNQIIYNKTYFRRVIGNNTATSKDYYYGYRDSINFLSQYNFNLDNRIIIGFENEFDAANFNTWAVSKNQKTDEAIYSQFFDYQFRPLENLYLTLGARRDHHTTSGNYETGRATFAYNKNNSLKYRGSIGTGIRFATLNDYFYDTNVKEKEIITPEKSYSVDLGLDKDFENSKLSLGIFYTEYDDNISNWITNRQSGSPYTISNSGGRITTKGFEISNNIKLQDYNFKIGYTFTDAFDGEDCQDPGSSCIDEMPVRVPRHSLITKIGKSYSFFNIALLSRFVSETRDYGNSNNNFKQVILDSYHTHDLKFKFDIFKKYNFYLDINNLLNKKYSQAYQYSSMGRNINFGLKHKF